MSERNLVACGMYAFNPSLQQAWRTLFENFDWQGLRIELSFDSLTSVAVERLLLGHTCGYPLMTRLRDSFSPLCVPLFAVPGTEGSNYSSRIVVSADSGIESLQDCRNGVVAINGYDSNSGMNVLRYEIARLGTSGNFFSEVFLSGTHLASVEAVASGRAQVAAIDCVSFQLIEDHDPALVNAVRCIGFSARSCGLPFVLPKELDSADTRSGINQALQQAFEAMPRQARERLHLQGFAPVDFDDYDSILEMENYAVSAAYDELK